MRESGVGRVLVASLHQAIGEILPTRLGFYENWLTPEGLRDGTIGLPPLYAVLSFLRQEGPAYGDVARTAGAYAAEWTVASMSPFGRSFISRLPRLVRRRVVLGRAAELVHMSYDGSRATSRTRKGVARMTVKASVFCSVREPVPHPLCGFYAAMCERMLTLFDIETSVTVESCRGAGGDACVLRVPLAPEQDAAPAETS